MRSVRKAAVTAALAVAGLTLVPVGSSLGAATAARPGDFDGDGRVDLAIGVPGEAIGSKRDAGAVNILHGSSTGLTAAATRPGRRTRRGSSGRPRAGRRRRPAMASGRHQPPATSTATAADDQLPGPVPAPRLLPTPSPTSWAGSATTDC